jgi:hypothetical protein
VNFNFYPPWTDEVLDQKGNTLHTRAKCSAPKRGKASPGRSALDAKYVPPETVAPVGDPTAGVSQDHPAVAGQKVKTKKGATDETRKLAAETARQELLAAAKAAGLTVSETSGVFKVLSEKSKLWLSISKKGTSLHLVGFNVESPVVGKVTEEQAKVRHIGRVRGEASLTADLVALKAAFAKALAIIQVGAVLALFVR